MQNIGPNEFANETSDSSDQTIQNEDASIDTCGTNSVSMKKSYFLKVKEFICELNQHVYDLNILRKLFRHYVAEVLSDNNKLVSIFGNIDELYECSLHLFDLLEDMLTSFDDNQSGTLQASPNNNNLHVGHIFWEFAEGAEFDVYKKYASNLQENNVHKCLSDCQTIVHLNDFLANLADICRYLLPKLLQGPIYYMYYLYETVEYLIDLQTQHAFLNNDNRDENADETDDLEMLNQTLDTLKPLRFYLNELGLVKKSVQHRPIETSLNTLPCNYTNQDHLLIKQNDYLIRVLQTTCFYKINKQTENKLKELDLNTENFRQKTSFQLNDNNLDIVERMHQQQQHSISMTPGTNQNKAFNFSYLFRPINAYLYDTCLYVCKTNHRIQKPQQHTTNSLKDTIQTQSKTYKLTERHIYLFDENLIVLKVESVQPNNQTPQHQYHQQAPFKFKLKHNLQLSKCQLYDRTTDDDPHAFELEQTNSDAPVDYFLFICKTQADKDHLMALLCYAKYKTLLDRQLQILVEQENQLNPLPIPPPNYPFDAADTPAHIIFDSQTMGNAQVTFTDGPSIKAATIDKLVERLTHHLYLYTNFSRIFLICYREFCTPVEFFNLLMERFSVPDLNPNYLDVNSVELQKRYKREYQQPIKLKVINVLKHWIDGYFYDFNNSDLLLSMLNDFVLRLGKTNKRYQDVLIKALTKKLQTTSGMRSARNSVTQSINSSLTNLNGSVNNISLNDVGYLCFDSIDLNAYPQYELFLEDSYPYDILTVHPLEFARQATLMESELYKSIGPSELISLGWTKSSQLKNELSPNVCKLINLSNKFTYWYAKCIVDTLNFDERCKVMQRILDIAGYFNEMNNFSGLKEIYAALETSSVRRLLATRSKINLESQEIYKNFVKLFDNHDNGYFERLKKCNPPCIPFIGIHLTIILKTYEFNKIYDDRQRQHITYLQQQAKQNIDPSDTSSETVMPSDISVRTLSTTSSSDSRNLINFSKYRLLVDFVTDLLQYQYVSYRYRVHDKLRSFINEEIDNYYEKSAAQLTETNFGESSDPLADLLADQIQTSLILNQDMTSEQSMKQNQIQLIENWLYTKSKQIEPEPYKYTQYPRLRNYTLQSPKCSKPSTTKNPEILRSTSMTPSYTSQQSTDKSQIIPAAAQNSTAKQTAAKDTVSYQRKPPRKPSPPLKFELPDLNASSQPASSRLQPKWSASSADSSTPNSPPPNYDDVFHGTTQNCFDNLTYFRNLSEPLVAKHEDLVLGNRWTTTKSSTSINNRKNNLLSSQSLSSTNLILYENQSSVKLTSSKIQKNSSANDLTNICRTIDSLSMSRPAYTPPPPPLPTRQTRKMTYSSSSSSSSSTCGLMCRTHDPNSILYPTSQCSTESISSSVSPKNI